MADETTLSTLISNSGVVTVGDIIRDASSERRFYAFVKTNRDNSGAQDPTNFRLRTISESAAELDIELIFVLVEDDKQDILSNTKAMVIRQYPDHVRNVFPTFGSRGVIVWIEPKRPVLAMEAELIERTIREFLAFLKVTLEDVHFTSSENLPTQTVILKALRLLAPLSQSDLHAELEGKGFQIPNEAWLAHTLDKIRKANFVIRSKAGEYTLTLQGLTALGSGKGRNSPDVTRALALPKRRT